MSDYFDSSQNRLSDGLRAKAADVNDLRDEVGVGFDKLPTSDDIKHGKSTYGVDSGIADAYAVTMTYTRLAYVTGMEVAFIPSNTSTGASTINVDGLGAKNIKQPDDTEISAGVITAGSVIILRYNGTYFTISGGGLLDSTAAASASAAAAAASETNAAASAAAALSSENAAATSETNAAASETNAATSETNAAASAAAAAVIETDLSSNDTGKGASMVGIEDAASKITATTVEGALAEIAADDWVTSARLADNLLINANAIQFNLAAGVGVGEGQVAWNAVSKTLDLGMPGGVVQQMGQEIPLYVKNTSGVTVNDGDAVYVSGSTGVNLIIGLADASDLSKCSQVGLVTTAAGIAHNAFGIVARFGAVRGLDTTGTPVGEVWADNDPLYLSATTPGALTKVPPGTPHFTVTIGIVINTHATQGIIGADPKQAISANVALGVIDLVAPTQGAVKAALRGHSQYAVGLTNVVQSGVVIDADLDSTTLVGGDLAADEGLRITGSFVGTLDATSGTVVIKFVLGSTEIVLDTLDTNTGGDEELHAEILVFNKTPASAQRLITKVTRYNGTTLALTRWDYSTMAEDTTGNLDVKFTTTNSKAGDSATQRIFMVERI